jgi:molybdopterin-binding protein
LPELQRQFAWAPRSISDRRPKSSTAAKLARTVFRIGESQGFDGSVEVAKGATTAHVKVDIGGIVVASSITNASAENLNLAAGKKAYAIIKASDVIVGTD